jgi:DNA-binding response OmpR family regulator
MTFPPATKATAPRPIVLYVDDDMDDMFLMERAVRQIEPAFTLHTATGMKAATAYLEEGGVPALVITDYVLQNFRGCDLLLWLGARSVLAQIPTVVLSDRDDEVCVAHCYACGADSFLQKSGTLDELSETVRTLGRCFAAATVTLEPLKGLPGYRICRTLELRAELEQHGEQNEILRQKLLSLRAELDIARAEAKDEKRKYPFPGKH